MDKQQTSQEDVYEQYVDASVALFMKYYCDTMYDGVANKDAASDQDDNDTFPAELDARCRSLIKKTVRRQRFRKKVRYAGKAMRYFCSIAVVCLALISFLFITVEAVRVPIINYYIEHSENNYLEIGGNDHSAEDVLNDSFDIADPLSGLIPDDYVLVTQEGDSISNFTTIYKNSHNSSIFISGRPLANVRDIDLQGAENIQRFQLYNCNVMMAEEDNATRLVLIHEESSTTITLVIVDDSRLDAVEIADDLLRKIS